MLSLDGFRQVMLGQAGSRQGRLSRAISQQARLLFALVLTSLVMPGTGLAQGSYAEQTQKEIVVRTTCIMPKALARGYFPVEIEVSNQRDRSVSLGLELGSPASWDDRVLMVGTIQLEPGESKKLDWLSYAMPDSRSFGNTQLKVSEGNSTLIWLQVHQVDSASSSKSSAPLLASSDHPEKFAEQLNGTPSLAGAVRAEGCLPADLPTDWRAYSALSFVALDLSGSVPEAVQLEAILDWVSTGGLLVLVGSHSQAEQLLSSQGAPPSERARISGPSTEGPNRRLVYRHQFGRIVIDSGKGHYTTPDSLFLDNDWNFPSGFASSQDPPKGTFPNELHTSPLKIPGLRSAPVASLITVLLIFGILVGPVQFRRQRKKGASPFRFLVVTPLLGFGFSAFIVIFSLLRQGLDVKESSISITWLDQQSHKATTLAKRVTFSGSVFRNDLHYSGRTAAAPISSRRYRDPKTFTINMDRGGTLEGDFLPVRMPTAQLVATVTNARGRIEFEQEDGQLYAVNGLDVEVKTLTYRDAAGTYFTLAEGHSLAPGTRALVSPTQAIPNFYIPELKHFVPDVNKKTTGSAKEKAPKIFAHLPPILPLRSYAAQLTESPFLEDGGVERNSLAQSHLLIGSLPEDSQ